MNDDHLAPWMAKGRARFACRHCFPIDPAFAKGLNPTIFVGSLAHTNLHDPWSGEAPLPVVKAGIDAETVAMIRDLQASGIRVMTYVACRQVDRTMFDAEDVERLAARDADGAILCAFETRYFKDIVRTCYNNPDWLEHMTALHRLHLKEAGVDGIWVDISEIFVDCRCRYCADKFREEYGYELAEAGAASGAKSNLFHISEEMGTADDTRVADMSRHYEQWSDIDASSALTSNTAPTEESARGGSPSEEPAAPEALDETVLGKRADLVAFRVRSYDTFFQRVGEVMVSELGRAPTYLCNGYGMHRDGVLLESGFRYAPYDNIYFFKWGNLLTRGSCLATTRCMDGIPTVSQLMIACAEGAAFNGYFMNWGHHLWESSALQRAQAAFNTFLERYEEVYANQKDVSKIAVLVSLFGDQISGGTNYDRSSGLCQLLSDLHLPHDFVLTDNQPTQEALSGYDLLILPDLSIMDDTLFETIQGYLRAGGRVLVTGQGPAYREDGSRREQALEGDVVTVAGDQDLDYPKNRFVGPDWGIVFREPDGDLAAAVRRLCGDSMVTTDAPVSVKISLTEIPGARLLQMVNYECGMRLVRQTIYPHEQITVSVRTDSDINRVTRISPDIDGYEETLAFTQEGAFVKITVPELVHYNLIRIET